MPGNNALFEMKNQPKRKILKKTLKKIPSAKNLTPPLASKKL